MGRSADKVESMETQIAQLMIAAQKLRRGSYTKAPQHSGFGAGAVKAPSLTTAKDVEASRLKFSGKPAFDPTGLLPDSTAAWYARPIDLALPLEDFYGELPHVQVKGSRAEVLKLLHSLDDSGRLAILPEQHVRDGVRSGMFALMKSPPNPWLPSSQLPWRTHRRLYPPHGPYHLRGMPAIVWLLSWLRRRLVLSSVLAKLGHRLDGSFRPSRRWRWGMWMHAVHARQSSQRSAVGLVIIWPDLFGAGPCWQSSRQDLGGLCRFYAQVGWWQTMRRDTAMSCSRSFGVELS